VTDPALTLEQAADKAAGYAELDAKVAKLEARRKAAHARIDAVMDAMVAPLLASLKPLHEDLGNWWNGAGEEIRKGKKSIELGGCTIGSRLGNLTLYGPTDQAEAIKSLARTTWGPALLTTTVSLNKPVIKAALPGPNGKQLVKLGFSIGRSESFFIDTSAAAKLGAGTRTSTAQ
jgi:hypothetical protein